MIGSQILHYKIRDKIGAGGMGEVYLAHDSKLDRDVALKFIPESFQKDREARERLLREAQATSKLGHANIVAIHAIEQADGRDFIVMEYVPGRPLDEIIAEGSLDMDRALALARQITDAMAAAHEKGIIHRDLKTANIIIDERGRARVLDFGLARFSGATELTEAGSTLGTAAYMSPEQAQGQQLDHRSDLFSLGVILFEMITGQRPFGGDHKTAIAYNIVNVAHEPLARYKSNVPDELERIVAKALRKNIEERYQSAPDLLADLKALRSVSDSQSGVSASAIARAPYPVPPTTPLQRKRPMMVIMIAALVVALVAIGLAVIQKLPFGGGDRAADGQAPATQGATAQGTTTQSTGRTKDGRIMLAVLPFENLGAADDEYFADGITEEITARLSAVDGLGVIARTSVMQYKGTAKRVQDIGRELGVDYVLEGTVRWQRATGQASRVRITPQLIRVTDATHMWAGVFDEPMTAVFQVQTDVAKEVVRELDVTLLDREAESLEAQPTENMEAYDFYLRGMDVLNETGGFDETNLRVAQQMFEKAIELDPNFLLAYTELSRTHSDMYWFHYDRTEDRVMQSKHVADRALELSPNSPEAHAALGWYYYHGRSNYERANESFERSLDLRPNHPGTVSGIAFVQRRMGLWDDALEGLRTYVRLDPRSSEAQYSIGETLFLTRQFDEALKVFNEATVLWPANEWLHISQALTFVVGKGDIASARQSLERAAKLRLTDQLDFTQIIIETWARNFGVAVERLGQVRTDVHENQHVSYPTDLYYALVYRAMGRRDLAKTHFQAAREWLQERVKANPGDPRYRGALGVAYAGLGMRDEALREGKKGIELQPISADAMKAVYRRHEMAAIHTLLGEKGEAVEYLEFLLSVPGPYTRQRFQLDPTWDSLRDHPRFQKLVSSGG